MKDQKTRAQSLVEFAILLPVFLLIVLGIFDLGRVIYTLSALHNAAREGARYGAVHHCDHAGIIAAARHYAIGLGDGVEIFIQEAQGGDPEGLERIIVTATFDFQTVTPLVGVFLGDDNTITLSSQSRHHIESPTECPK
jgi:hypothetical protein